MKCNKHAIWLAGFAAMAGVLLLSAIAFAQGGDTPVIVRDRSISIRPATGSLNDWKPIGRGEFEHPNQAKRMAAVEVTGPNSRNATCAGRGRCLVEMTWSTGQSVQILARAGGRGLSLFCSIPFDDPGWDKSTPEWRFLLPADATSVVTIRDRSTNGRAETVCSGKGCQVTIHYQ